MAVASVGDEPVSTRVVVVGAGFAGIGTAIRLLSAGERDFVVLERADDVGGTWRDNTYPGCRCDVNSHLYSFSFAPNPNWSDTFSAQPEIWEYLRSTATRFGVLPYIRFGHELIDASYGESECRWLVTTSQDRYEAEFLVLATGFLVEPRLPAIDGIDRFEGTVMHSARWDPDQDLCGQRVAVVGTGASSIQIVPAIQPDVATLTLFQRTPAWVVPHPGRPVRTWERRMYRLLPFTQRLVRARDYWEREPRALVRDAPRHDEARRAGRSRAPGSSGPRPGPAAEAHAPLRARLQAGAHLERLLPGRVASQRGPCDRTDRRDPAPLDCDRGRYRARGRHHHLRDRVPRDRQPRAPAGPRSRPATGDRRPLAGVYASDAPGYLGTTFPGFPNMFLLAGPNTGLGHSSMVFMIESQLNYVIDALAKLSNLGVGTFETRPEVAAAYNADLQERLPHTVWGSGCASWYLDANGRNITLWPDFTFVYRRRTRHFDPDDFLLGRRAPARASSPA